MAIIESTEIRNWYNKLCLLIFTGKWKFNNNNNNNNNNNINVNININIFHIPSTHIKCYNLLTKNHIFDIDKWNYNITFF